MIISYSWLGYSLIDTAPFYVNHIHNHGDGDFCYGYDITNHIEFLWGIYKVN